MVKALNPNIQIIGVEPAGANAMCQVRRWVGLGRARDALFTL